MLIRCYLIKFVLKKKVREMKVFCHFQKCIHVNTQEKNEKEDRRGGEVSEEVAIFWLRVIKVNSHYAASKKT